MEYGGHPLDTINHYNHRHIDPESLDEWVRMSCVMRVLTARLYHELASAFSCGNNSSEGNMSSFACQQIHYAGMLNRHVGKREVIGKLSNTLLRQLQLMLEISRFELRFSPLMQVWDSAMVPQVRES